jgi:arachidonate 15-lipoxygenase
MQFSLSAYQYDTLGHYDKSFKDLYGATVAEVFEDHPQVVQHMKTLQKDLADIEETIKKRNSARKVPYNGMLPSRILNSTSI